MSTRFARFPRLLRGLLALAPLALLAAGPGCEPVPDESDPDLEGAQSSDGAESADEDVAEAESDLLGSGNYGGDCSPQLRGFLDTVRLYGRVAVASRAYEQCIERGVKSGVQVIPGWTIGPYRQCNGDPFFGQPQSVQIERLLDAARSANDLAINCTGGGGNASAWLGGYDDFDAESLSFSSWLQDVYNQTSLPLCSPSQPQPCRWAAAPWPYSQAAETLWHEGLHQHGYTHGANDQAGALNACGYPGDPTWHFQVNTMPYLAGQCVSAVIDRSGTVCGNLETCGPGMLKMITGVGASTCECVPIPPPWGRAPAMRSRTSPRPPIQAAA